MTTDSKNHDSATSPTKVRRRKSVLSIVGLLSSQKSPEAEKPDQKKQSRWKELLPSRWRSRRGRTKEADSIVPSPERPSTAVHAGDPSDVTFHGVSNRTETRPEPPTWWRVTSLAPSKKETTKTSASLGPTIRTVSQEDSNVSAKDLSENASRTATRISDNP